MIHNKTLVLICKYNCLYWLSLLCTNVFLPCPLCPPPPRGFASNRLVVASASQSTGKKREPLDHNRKHGGYFKPVFRVTHSYSSVKTYDQCQRTCPSQTHSLLQSSCKPTMQHTTRLT